MNYDVALNKLQNICSRQEKSPADVVASLKKWDVPREDHQKIISKLKSEQFIDEKRYAIAFARDKIRFDHWGMVKIRIMLHQKGIGREIVEEVLNNIDRDEYRSMIEKELNKKRKSVKGTPYQIWAKLARFGSSKGYEMQDMEPFLGSERE